MKYPISVPADGLDLRRPRVAVSLMASDAWHLVIRNWGLLAALAITFTVHAPTLRYFFDGDDFVVLGDIQYRGNSQFLIDTVRMHDIVPSWRPLTGLIYMLEWRAFGLDAMGWRVVNLSVHLGSLVLLYTLVTRLTKRAAIGATAALIFGVSGAHFDTVTYITALPHVLATFFVLASLLAIVSYAQDGERNRGAFVLSFGCFVLAFLSNEGAFVYAPLIVAAYMVYARRWHKAPIRLVLHATPFFALAAGWLSFYESCTCKQLKFDGYSFGPHVLTNYAVYISFIMIPVRAIPLEPDKIGWIAVAVFGAVAAWFVMRGPQLARLSLLGIALALLPFVPVEIWTASRYTYGAVAFFAPVAAIAGYAAYSRVQSLHRYARLPANAIAIIIVATIAALYGWQSYAQDSRSGRGTDRWALLSAQLKSNYESVPPGTTIYIVDGPWTTPMWQYTWVPSVARALYGDAAAFDLPRSAYEQDPPRAGHNLYLQWTPNGLQPIAEQQVLAPQ